MPALVLGQSGHWVLDRAAAAAVHVDGGTHRPDAQVALPADAVRDAAFTVQGTDKGFVVGRDKVWTFDKSTLTVIGSGPSAAPEVPIPIEVVGGPYLVYQQAGTVVRLGDPSVVAHAPGKLGRPVRTEDGTVWVPQPESGAVCAMRRDALDLDCSVHARPGAPGGLTVTASTATFVDAGTDVDQLVRDRALDSGGPVGVDLPNDVLLGDQSAGPRLPVISPATSTLRLLDASGYPARSPGAPPLDVALGAGRFAPPIASGNVVTVLDLATSRLLIYTGDAVMVGSVQLPPGTGAESVVRGEDGRIYADDAGGSATHIVSLGGQVADVPLGQAPTGVAVAASPLLSKPRRTPPVGRVTVTDSPVTTTRVQAPPNGPPMTGPGGGGLPVPPTAPIFVPPVPPGPSGIAPLPPARPDPPTAVKAVWDGADGATVTWKAADGHGLPLTYAVQVAGGPGTATVTGTAAAVTGLAHGTSYTFLVTARSSAGLSDPASSDPVVTGLLTGLGVLTAPTALRASRGVVGGRATVTVSWAAPNAPGWVITGYTVTGSGNTNVSATVTGTTWADISDNTCWSNAPVSYQVVARAHTDPNTGITKDATSPIGTVSLPVKGICAPDAVLVSARANPDGTVTVVGACQFSYSLPANDRVLMTPELADGSQAGSIAECIAPGGSGSDQHTMTVPKQPAGTDVRLRVVVAGAGDTDYSPYTTVHIP